MPSQVSFAVGKKLRTIHGTIFQVACFLVFTAVTANRILNKGGYPLAADGLESRSGSSCMQIVFVNRYFYPDESATSQILSDLAFHLAGEGNEVSVITSRLNYGLDSRYYASREVIDKVKVHRIWTTQFNRDHLPGRFIDFVSFHISAIVKLLSLSNKDTLVVLKTDPPMLATAVSPFLRLKRIRYFNWLQDLFPEVAQAAGFRIAGGMTGSMLKTLRNRSLRGAHMNVVIGDRMRQRLIEAGVSSRQITLIPNWSAGQDIVPVAATDNLLRSEWGLQHEFVVGYSGNFGRAHEFQTLLDAAKVLLSVPNIKILLVGHGVKRAEVENLVHEYRLTNVLFQPFQPRSRLPESLGVADVHIVSLLPNMEGLIVPSKTYGIAAAGRPVIFVGDPEGEVAGVLEEHEFGSSVSIGDAKALADAIIRMADDRAYCAKLGQNARRAFDASYSDEVALGKWRALILAHSESLVS